MSKLVNHRTKDDAVSPVVGVMLMIVVTVVIAAVVALFATNVVTSTEAAPVVVMDMNAYYSSSSDDNTNLVMSMRGGDPLELSKLTVVLTESTGNYGFSVTGLDTKSGTTHLKTGEKLTVVSKADAEGSSNLITPIGGTVEEVLEVFGTEYNVGKKVHVMVTFNENSIIYDKDIIVKAGAEETEGNVTISISAGFGTGTFALNGGTAQSSVSFEVPKGSTVALSKGTKADDTLTFTYNSERKATVVATGTSSNSFDHWYPTPTSTITADTSISGIFYDTTTLYEIEVDDYDEEGDGKFVLNGGEEENNLEFSVPSGTTLAYSTTVKENDTVTFTNNGKTIAKFQAVQSATTTYPFYEWYISYRPEPGEVTEDLYFYATFREE